MRSTATLSSSSKRSISTVPGSGSIKVADARDGKLLLLYHLLRLESPCARIAAMPPGSSCGLGGPTKTHLRGAVFRF